MSRFKKDLELLKRKGTLVSFGFASGFVLPFELFMLTDKNIKLASPSVQNYLVTPEEGTRYSRLFFDVVSKGIVKIYVSEEYPFSAEGVQQAQTDLTRGKSAGKLVIKIGD